MKIIKRLSGLPVERALQVLAGRWKAVILIVLLDGPHRTHELEERIAGMEFANVGGLGSVTRVCDYSRQIWDV